MYSINFIYLCIFIVIGTQALVRAGSNHSSISTEDVDPSPTEQIVGRARAIVDQIPGPYDKDTLKFKVIIIHQFTNPH